MDRNKTIIKQLKEFKGRADKHYTPEEFKKLSKQITILTDKNN